MSKESIYTPTNLRKHIFGVLKDVANNNDTVMIPISQKHEDTSKGAVIISQERYEQLKELEYLEKTGTLDVVLKRMDHEKKDDFDMDDAY